MVELFRFLFGSCSLFLLLFLLFLPFLVVFLCSLFVLSSLRCVLAAQNGGVDAVSIRVRTVAEMVHNYDIYVT